MTGPVKEIGAADRTIAAVVRWLLSPGVTTEARDRLAVLPAGYTALFDNLVVVVEPDQRIRGVWLSGSVGRGSPDAGSDLDVVLAVRDDAFAAFAQDWRIWLGRVTPTVIARELPGMPGSFYSVTETCERFDVVTEPVSRLLASPHTPLVPVLDRDGLTERLAVEQLARQPNPERIAEIVEEFYRQQAIFPAAVVAREDWLLGVVGVVNTQTMLYQLLVETNQPLPVMGVKQWSARLTDDQRRALESLPVPQPDRAEVVAAMLAVRQAFRTLGRGAVEQLGLTWPEYVDAAVADYYSRELAASNADLTTVKDTSGE